MHTHLGLPSWGSRQGKVWLAYGITSLRTPADALYRVIEEKESIRAGRRVGPRVFYTGATFDGDRIYYTGALALNDGEELEQEMKRALALDYDVVKTYVRLSDPLQKEAIEKAHAAGIFVTSHEVYPAVAYGVDGIEHLSGTSRRGFSPKLTELRRSYDDVVELIARSGVYFTPTVLLQGGWSLALAREPGLFDEPRFQALFPPFVKEGFLRGVRAGDAARSTDAAAPIFSTIDRIHERGGKLIAGTDSPLLPYGLSLLLEIEQLSEAGLGPMAAIESATRVAAEALGAGDELGTIEPGKVADLVLLSRGSLGGHQEPPENGNRRRERTPSDIGTAPQSALDGGNHDPPALSSLSCWERFRRPLAPKTSLHPRASSVSSSGRTARWPAIRRCSSI